LNDQDADIIFVKRIDNAVMRDADAVAKVKKY
jgi:hypothetical protein